MGTIANTSNSQGGTTRLITIDNAEQKDNQEEESRLVINNLKSAKILSREQRNIRKTRKVTKLVTVVTLNFAICWLPAHLFIIIIVFLDKRDLSNNVYTMLLIFKVFAHTLSYLTPILNPIAYGFYNDSFRKPLRLLFKQRTSTTEVNNSQLSQMINLTARSKSSKRTTSK